MLNVEIKGLDNGFLDTKDDKRRIFRSAYSLVNDTLSDKNKIAIDGVDYYFGHGNTTGDVDKSDSVVNMVCTLGNLAMTGEKDYFLVVGLPIIQCKTSMQGELRNTILGYNNCEVIYRSK